MLHDRRIPDLVLFDIPVWVLRVRSDPKGLPVQGRLQQAAAGRRIGCVGHLGCDLGLIY